MRTVPLCLLREKKLVQNILGIRQSTENTTEEISKTEVHKMQEFEIYCVFKQEALLWQRDCATRLSVEILQLQNIPFEN